MRFLPLLVVSLLFSGCTSMPVHSPVSDPEGTWAQRQDELARIKVWNLSGRLAVNNGVEAWNLDLDWQQNDDDYQIQISGPFGAGKIKLIGNSSGVLLYDSDDQTYYADRPEELLYETTGMHMPVTGLRYWIVGLASPEQKGKVKLDPQGRLAYLEDSHWHVKFRRYMDVNGLQLPRKIFIDRPDKEIDIRLVIDSWKLGLSQK